MPYTILKTNGSLLTTVPDATLDTTTDLSLVGKNYAGYGNVVNENFVKLLENFSNSTAPSKPLQGQLWYNSSAKTLNVYNGSAFKGLASMYIQSGQPNNTVTGDLWWDTSASQLKTFDGSSFQLIGPTVSPKQTAIWNSLSPTDTSLTVQPVLVGTINGIPQAVVWDGGPNEVNEFTLSDSSVLSQTTWPTIKKGITLPNADANGSTTASNYYFWGTAAEALHVKNVAGGFKGQLLYQTDPDYTSFVSTATTSTINSGMISLLTYDNISKQPVFVTATNFLSANLPVATVNSNGLVQPDGTTITINGAVISAATQVGTTYTPSSHAVAGGANLTLTAGGAGSGTQNIKFQSGNGITVFSLNDTTIEITNSSPGANYPTSNAHGALTNDGSGSLSWSDVIAFHAYQSVQQTNIGSGIITPLVVDTIYNNSTPARYSGCYVTDNTLGTGVKIFQPGKAGWYQLNLTVTFNGATGQVACGFGLNWSNYLNAVLAYTAIPNTASTDKITIGTSVSIYLNAGDYIVPLGWQNSGGILDTYVDPNPAVLQRTTFSAMGFPIP